MIHFIVVVVVVYLLTISLKIQNYTNNKFLINMYKYNYKAEKQRENKSDFLGKSCLEQPTQYREWVLHFSTRPGGVVKTKITWVITFSVLWQAGVIAVNGISDAYSAQALSTALFMLGTHFAVG